MYRLRRLITFAVGYISANPYQKGLTVMCTTAIVSIGNRFGTFSFSTGVQFKKEPSLLEWAKADFDACFAYLFAQGRDEEAEVLFERLCRLANPVQ